MGRHGWIIGTKLRLQIRDGNNLAGGPRRCPLGPISGGDDPIANALQAQMRGENYRCLTNSGLLSLRSSACSPNFRNRFWRGNLRSPTKGEKNIP